jgi:phosphatidylserine/phosphatidylglycerophosphate/cardiolipin synthase-like enzyme
MIRARELFQAWQLVQESGLDLFSTQAAESLPTIRGWAGLGMPSDPVLSGPSALQALRAIQLAIADSTASAHVVELVATAPVGSESWSTTLDALKELLRSARRELLVLGFAMNHRDLEKELRAAALRGVSITIIGERARDDLRHLFQTWPATLDPIRCLQIVEPAPGQRLTMHAKVIVVDRATTLIGSANFTVGGLASNVELGLKVRGPVSRLICDLVAALERGHWFEVLE